MIRNLSSSDFGDQNIEVVLGDGSGRNWVPWDDGLPVNGDGQTVGMGGTDFADVDNDGDLDVGATATGYNEVIPPQRIYLNNRDGTWSLSYSSLVGSPGFDFSFGDINRDGLADFAETSDTTNVYFGNGDGTFEPADGNLPGTSSSRRRVCLGDVDADGGMDVAFIYVQGDIKRPQVWRFDRPSGQWQNLSAGLVAGPYEALRLCDLNNDGRADLIVARVQRPSISDIQILRRDTAGGGSWTLETTIPVNQMAGMNWIQSGVDVDHNGFADIITLSEHMGGYSYNTLDCYVEASVPSQPFLVPVSPNGAEVWRGGSIHTIRWHSGNPSRQPDTLRLEYSVTGATGPWRLIADGVVDNGEYQWRVPDFLQSTQCFIRYTNSQAVATSRAAFEIQALLLALSADMLDFGLVVVGEDSARAFQVLNVGGASLTGMAYPPSGVFECVEGCGELNLAAGAQQTVTIRFTPTDTLLYEDTVLVATSGRIAVVRLTGRGQAPSDIGWSQAVARDLAFHPPYPNPFNATVRISYELPAETSLRICAWNLLGERVQELAGGVQPAGFHTLSIDAGHWASGLYFFSLETPSAVHIQKALLLK